MATTANPSKMHGSIGATSTGAISTIRVDYRESRSIPSAAIQGILKHIGTLILKAGDVEPTGSPRITLPKRTDKKCDVQESQIEGVWIYKLAMEGQEKKRVEHKIYYFAVEGSETLFQRNTGRYARNLQISFLSTR